MFTAKTARKLSAYLLTVGQALLPMLELLEGAKASIGELMHDSAVALVEQLLTLLAQEIAGVKQRDRDAGSVLWHGAQRGVVSLAERQLHVQCRGCVTRAAMSCVYRPTTDCVTMRA